MEDPAEHTLVVKALVDGLSNCVEWEPDQARIVVEREGLNTGMIRRALIAHVRRRGGFVVRQKPELREYWADRYRFYYMVILPYEGCSHGLFVEMRLT